MINTCFNFVEQALIHRIHFEFNLSFFSMLKKNSQFLWDLVSYFCNRMMYKHQLFCTLININILICFWLYQKIMLNVHAAKGCNAMYEVYILAIYHVANAERNCFRGKTMLRTSCIHCKYHFQKKNMCNSCGIFIHNCTCTFVKIAWHVF